MFDACGDVDGIADEGVFEFSAAADGSDDDFAGVEADADVDRITEGVVDQVTNTDGCAPNHKKPGDPQFSAADLAAMAQLLGRGHYGSIWRNKDGTPAEFTKARGKTGVLKDLGAMPIGARGWMRVAWKGGSAHVYAWEVTPDPKTGEPMLRFIDPQPGKLDVADYLDRAKAGSFYWLRVDKLVPTEDVLDLVKQS